MYNLLITYLGTYQGRNLGEPVYINYLVLLYLTVSYTIVFFTRDSTYRASFFIPFSCLLAGPSQRYL